MIDHHFQIDPSIWWYIPVISSFNHHGNHHLNTCHTKPLSYYVCSISPIWVQHGEVPKSQWWSGLAAMAAMGKKNPRHSESLNPNVLLLNPRVPWATGSTGETSHDHGTKIGTVIHHSFGMWTFRSFWWLLIPTLKVGRSGECQVTGDEIWRKSPSSPRIFPATSTVHHSSITMFLGKKWYKHPPLSPYDHHETAQEKPP